jgi:hypothetical protein
MIQVQANNFKNGSCPEQIGAAFSFLKEIMKILLGKMKDMKRFERTRGFLSGRTGDLSVA